MHIDWTKNLKTDEDRKRFETFLRNSKSILERLETIIDEKEQSLINRENSYSDFEDPNWAYKQAFRNGVRAAYASVKNYTKL